MDRYPSSMKAMFLRSLRTLFVLVLLLQGGVLAPAAMALDAGQAMADCTEGMGTSDNRPCCPASSSTLGGCASICLGTFAGPSQWVAMTADTRATEDSGLPHALHVSQTYTPVNPPPIA
jgi:hypothetical protein